MLARRCEMCNTYMEGLTYYREIILKSVCKYVNTAHANPEEYTFRGDVCLVCYEKLANLFNNKGNK